MQCVFRMLVVCKEAILTMETIPLFFSHHQSSRPNFLAGEERLLKQFLEAFISRREKRESRSLFFLRANWLALATGSFKASKANSHSSRYVSLRHWGEKTSSEAFFSRDPLTYPVSFLHFGQWMLHIEWCLLHAWGGLIWCCLLGSISY